MWIIREVTLKDSEALFNWRNDPEVYKYFFNPSPVKKTDHEAWLVKIVKSEQVKFFIANFKGEDVGTVRFDLSVDQKEAEIGIYLDSKFHGKRLGGAMLDACEIEFKKSFPQVVKIIAKVLPENIASEKMFVKNGYEKKFIQLEKITGKS